MTLGSDVTKLLTPPLIYDPKATKNIKNMFLAIRSKMRLPWGLWVAHETTWLGEQPKPATPQLGIRYSDGSDVTMDGRRASKLPFLPQNLPLWLLKCLGTARELFQSNLELSVTHESRSCSWRPEFPREPDLVVHNRFGCSTTK